MNSLSAICGYHTFLAPSEFSNLSSSSLSTDLDRISSLLLNELIVNHVSVSHIDKCRFRSYIIDLSGQHILFARSNDQQKNYIRDFHFIYRPILLMLIPKKSRTKRFTYGTIRIPSSSKVSSRGLSRSKARSNIYRWPRSKF